MGSMFRRFLDWLIEGNGGLRKRLNTVRLDK